MKHTDVCECDACIKARVMKSRKLNDLWPYTLPSGRVIDYPEEFYQTKDWKVFNLWVLSQRGFRCIIDRREQFTDGIRVIVHHLKSVEARPDLSLVANNVVTVCEQCHNRLHGHHDPRPTSTKEQRILKARAAQKPLFLEDEDDDDSA